MGCGCKQQPAPAPIVLEAKEDYVEIIDPTPLGYNRQEITRALDYFNAKIKRDDDKRFVIDLHNREFSNEPFEYDINGELLFRLEDKIKYMHRLLMSYEHSINRKKQ